MVPEDYQYQNKEELMEDFLDNYDDTDYVYGQQTMSVADFRESYKYGLITPGDGNAHYLVNGEDSGLSAFVNPQPLNCDGVVWYGK